MPKKLTINQSEYQKQYNRLVREITKINAQEGTELSTDIIPPLPKRVTRQSIEKIKQIKPKQIKEFAYKESANYEDLVSVSKPKVSKTSVPKQTKIKADDTTFSLPKIDTKPSTKSSTTKKKSKRKLTEEEKHQHRVEGGKKAWQTRLKNKEQQSQVYYPTFNQLDVIRERIANLKRFDVFDEPIRERKNGLLSIFDDNRLSVGDEEYANYLSEYEEEIAEHLNIITWSSDQEAINQSFARLGTLLNMGEALSIDQAEDLSFFAESMYNYDQGE